MSLTRSGFLDDAVETLRNIPIIDELVDDLDDEDLCPLNLITPNVRCPIISFISILFKFFINNLFR